MVLINRKHGGGYVCGKAACGTVNRENRNHKSFWNLFFFNRFLFYVSIYVDFSALVRGNIFLTRDDRSFRISPLIYPLTSWAKGAAHLDSQVKSAVKHHIYFSCWCYRCWGWSSAPLKVCSPPVFEASCFASCRLLGRQTDPTILWIIMALDSPACPSPTRPTGSRTCLCELTWTRPLPHRICCEFSTEILGYETKCETVLEKQKSLLSHKTELQEVLMTGVLSAPTLTQ